MSRTALGSIAFDLVLIAVGYCLLSAWLRGASVRRRATYVGVALIAGAGTSAVVLEIAVVAGVRLTLAAFFACAILLSLAGLAFRVLRPVRVTDAEPVHVANSVWGELWLLIPGTLLTVLAGGLLFAGLRSTPWLDDSWAFWLPKGIVLDKLGLDIPLFVHNGINPTLISPDYPLGWSTLIDTDLHFAGGVDIRVVNAVAASVSVAFLAAAARLLWGVVRPQIIVCGLLVIALSPEFLRQTLGGGVDVPLACFVALFALAAGRWLFLGESMGLMLAGIAAATALALKNEGMFELVLVAAGLAVLAVGSRYRKRLLLFGVSCACAVLTAVPWFAWRQAHHVQDEISVTQAFDPVFLAHRTNRIWPATSALLDHLFTATEWLLIVPVAVALSLVAALVFRRAMFLVPIGILFASVAALIWVYWTDTNDLSFRVGTSSYRVVDTTSLIAALTIVLIAEEIARAVVRRRAPSR